MYRILILGGDSRQLCLYHLLTCKGYITTIYYAPEDTGFSMEKALQENDIILGPIPFTKDGKNIFSINSLEQLDIIRFLNCLTSKHHIFGGNIPDQVTEYTTGNHIACHDYMKMDDVTLANTVTTAEGAIAEAIRLSPLCLHNNRCLVMGFGRCGKTLALKLKGLSAHVTVADTDTKALALAASMGLNTSKTDAVFNHARDYTFIFNTVPAPVFHKAVIHSLSTDVTIIDIASAPGGVDFEECRRLNIRAKLCSGLPGIYTPQTSADILYQGIVNYLS